MSALFNLVNGLEDQKQSVEKARCIAEQVRADVFDHAEVEFIANGKNVSPYFESYHTMFRILLDYLQSLDDGLQETVDRCYALAKEEKM